MQKIMRKGNVVKRPRVVELYNFAFLVEKFSTNFKFYYLFLATCVSFSYNLQIVCDIFILLCIERGIVEHVKFSMM